MIWEHLSHPWRCCLEEAWAAYGGGSVPIGAAIVGPSGRVIARGRNRIREAAEDFQLLSGTRLAHAEMNALLAFAKRDVDPAECTLYSTTEPCLMCFGAARMHGIAHLRYASRDPVAGSAALAAVAPFKGQRPMQVVGPQRQDLELVLMAMLAEFLLQHGSSWARRAQSLDPACASGIQLGRRLATSGDLARLSARKAPVGEVIDELARQLARLVEVGPRSPDFPQADEAIPARRPSGGGFLLIVTGPPAAGRSALARELARDLALPLITKDGIKETLFDTLGWKDREWSSRLGRASMELLFHFLEGQLTAGRSVAVEANFIPRFHAPQFLELVEGYGCEPLQVHCTADDAVLLRRMAERHEAGKRHPGHVDHLATPDDLAELVRPERHSALEIGGAVLEVDTTDFQEVNYRGLLDSIASIRARMEAPSERGDRPDGAGPR